jgi:hypothetical protein
MKTFSQYIESGIEIIFLEKFNDNEESRPIKILIHKNIHDKIPNSEYIRKNIMEKYGFAVTYNEYFESTNFHWETKITSCIKAKRKK